MKSGLFAALIAVSLTLTATGAASGTVAQEPPRGTASVQVMPQKETQTARPFSAVLRYGPGTTSACQSFSESSSAICLLLALHVIQLSQKRVTETKL